MKASAGGSGVEEDETLPRMNQRYGERMEECGTNTETKSSDRYCNHGQLQASFSPSSFMMREAGAAVY